MNSTNSYGSNWIKTLAPNGNWSATACDSTGKYIAAVQGFSGPLCSHGSAGYTYTSSSGTSLV